jgi:NTP pyrophosphatase (non-canonical NTP hydrolase)
MTFDEYQEKAKGTNLTPGKFDGLLTISFMDKVLGLVGESGEFADKVKKILRDKNAELSEEDRQELVKELGDVLWYVALLADNFGVGLEKVAEINIEKLSSRKNRGKLAGKGDNR